MKYIVPIILLTFMAACEQAPKADKATIQDAQSVKEGEGRSYHVDTTVSVVQFIGTKPTGKHTGIFRLLESKLYVQDTLVTGGSIKINMSTLEDKDLAPTDSMLQHKLEAELKGPMFFDIEKYPVAIFEITGVSNFKPSVGKEVLMKDANYTVQGNLTIKDSTKNISFPAFITREKGVIRAEANFNIDRTLWGMTYRSDQSMQDKLINSQVNIQFKLVAKQ
ncbi:YceI family protein [Chitinophaga sancti]|uniref:YceI family protein n=1 Tax=Chitinophaga sancti TaxID=1004 RepID=UPI002A75D138|nr:YceI family protein [Chitinophaga sancti]WPQ64617.1 YceI family protein [Chitinophaga sancti]